MNWQHADWHEIAYALFWRLAPHGVTITRKDLGCLPADRVLVDNRSATEIRFTWNTLTDAQKLRDTLTASGEPVGVSQLQGRWMKMALVLMWKLAPDGLTLTDLDRSAVPADKTLLIRGYRDDVHCRFVPRTEAAAIAKSAAEHEGKTVVEAL